jgi:DNA-binding CsgD family transcriptional regulator
MEDLAREVARLAWRLEWEVESVQTRVAQSKEPVESNDSVGETLGRIEQRLSAVHGHTSELVERVPKNLVAVLDELKHALILRLDEATQATRSAVSVTAHGNDSPTGATHSVRSPDSAIASLTAQERKVFQLCFQTGFLSYRDIATQLDITPTAAKNLVNRIFLSERKRPLFAKQVQHGAVRVGLQPELQKRILRGDKMEPRMKRLAAPVQDAYPSRLD